MKLIWFIPFQYCFYLGLIVIRFLDSLPFRKTDTMSKNDCIRREVQIKLHDSVI